MRGLRSKGNFFVVDAEGQNSKEGTKYYGNVVLSDGMVSDTIPCNNALLISQLQHLLEEEVIIVIEMATTRFGKSVEITGFEEIKSKP